MATLSFFIILSLVGYVDCFTTASSIIARKHGIVFNVGKLKSITADRLNSRFSIAAIAATGRCSILFDSSIPTPTESYHGPTLPYGTSDDLPAMTAALQLAELGIDIAVGRSVVSPGQLGLFARCSDSVDSVKLPEFTLLCGYANPGTFLSTDVGDKTVRFRLTSSQTAVFFNRQLMSIGDALQLAALEFGNGTCGLAGHELSINEDQALSLHPVMEGYDRYFCPDLVNSNPTDSPITVQNFGQFCNDLAWDNISPPVSSEEYVDRSRTNNCVQLVWRLEYDESYHCLVPSWPVSVLSRDVHFENQEYMELGTHYGWGYWQATVDLEKLV